MIQIPLTDMIAKIIEQSGKTEEEINDKIKAKLDQLSGLISKEGAAHIIANELGVKLMPSASGRINIKDILMGMRNLEVLGKVTNNFGVREFQVEDRAGKVANLIVADETGSTRFVCWGDQADKVAALKEGDIIKVNAGYVKLNQGRTEVHLNDNSLITINPEGVTVDAQAAPTFSRKKIEDISDNADGIELLGAVVQVFDPKFFEVCPDCNKRTKAGDTGLYSCPEHGNIVPAYSYLINIFLDDGTGTIQTVFFRNQVENLLGKNADQVLSLRNDATAIEEAKTGLLGNMIKISGRASKNEMFDRIEFIAQRVDLNPSPDEELKTLNESEPKVEEAKAEEPKIEESAAPEVKVEESVAPEEEKVPSLDDIQ